LQETGVNIYVLFRFRRKKALFGDSFWSFLYQILCLQLSSLYFFETIGRF